MPTPSESTIQTQIQKLFKIFDYARLYAGVTSTNNFISLEASLISSAETDYAAALLSRVAGTRSRLDGFFADIGADLEPLIRTYGQYLSVPETSVDGVMKRLYDDYITNTKRVESRGFVFAAASAGGSNTGNGIVVRCGVDENGFAIENTYADAKNMRCVLDAMSGAEKWEEVFEIRGATAAPDRLLLAGSGKAGTITALSSRASNPYLKNPSFSLSTPSGATASPTDITSWTCTPSVSSTNYEVIGGTGVSGYYRSFPGDTTPLALRLKGTSSFTLTQNLETARTRFLKDRPYLVQLAYRRKSSATGTLAFNLGAITSASVDISTKTNDEWNILRLAVNTTSAYSSLDLTKDAWFKNFDEAGSMDFTITVTSLATGQLDLDDIIISPMTQFDGLWYAMVGTPASGNPTQWKLFDTFSFTDNVYDDGNNQYWIWRATGRYLPAVASPPGSTMLAAEDGAGNLNGAYKWKVTFVDKNGVESGGNATETTLTVTSKKVDLTVIPTGSTHIAYRKIYRTVAAGSVYKLVTTITDNSTTVYEDNIADGSLGATMPTGITFSDYS